MAEVLAAHSDYLWRTGAGWECVCGQRLLTMSVGAGEFFAQHQAATLTAAGFGDVREAKAQALEDAADRWQVRMDTIGRGSVEALDWLRARAAAVRGEG